MLDALQQRRGGIIYLPERAKLLEDRQDSEEAVFECKGRRVRGSTATLPGDGRFVKHKGYRSLPGTPPHWGYGRAPL